MSDKLKNILEWIECIVIAIVLALLIRYYVGTPTVVQMDSMYPTLKQGERLVLNRIPRTRKQLPKRGDIITFEQPSVTYIGEDKVDLSNPVAIYDKVPTNIFSKFAYYVLEWGKTSYIKRVIGLPGEHVQIMDGKVYINGEELDESAYLNSNVKTEAYGGMFTDIVVPEGYVFAGGGSFLDNGNYYFPNIPTEEIFSAPKKTGVNGKLYSALPLAYNGAVVKDFWFEFKDGQVVDYDAKEGKEVLTSILETDEGAKYLGEIALVPYGSPISAMDTLFYETLIDENASCHFALGASYNECIENGLNMSEEELLEHGMNQSFAHVDFMVGTSDLSIEATLKNGEKIFIFKNGKYTTEFDGYTLN